MCQQQNFESTMNRQVITASATSVIQEQYNTKALRKVPSTKENEVNAKPSTIAQVMTSFDSIFC